ncbi:unnamed protein product [Linum trigynum]|uniref:CCHC-type domain-containing protein n=1 Tax=Linum trigynum TaxID=586398 RepID=A0AAV2FB69_9ROSI
MLSTGVNENSTPAPALFPSGRPPDPETSQTLPGDNLSPSKSTSTTAPMEMLVDSTGTLNLQTISQSGTDPSNVTSTGEQPSRMATNDAQLPVTTQMAPPAANASTTHAQIFSYAKAVTGGTSLNSAHPSNTQWTPVGEHDLIPGERNGEPALRVSTDFKNRLCAPWHRTLVVRLLGIKVGFNTICSRLRAQWRPTGTMEVRDLDEDCYLVKLNNDQDYFKALTDGPWVIFDHYLVVQQWTPKFKLSDPLPKTMIVWVQLPALKIHFYHKEVLTSLGNLIGRTIKLDYHTLTQQRAKFARLAVEVDLSKPLVPRIWLDDDWQKVEYENLPTVCFECGKIGHQSTDCPLLRPSSLMAIVTAGGGDTQLAPTEETSETKQGFGPWMLVSRKSRRNSRENQGKGKSEKESGNHGQGKSNRNGKGVSKLKETNDRLPILSQQTPPLTQRSPGHERKEHGAKLGGGEKRNGKAIMREETTSSEKALLGSGPTRNSSVKQGPKPMLAADNASTSKTLARETRVSTHGQPDQAHLNGPKPILHAQHRPSHLHQFPTLWAQTGPICRWWKLLPPLPRRTGRTSLTLPRRWLERKEAKPIRAARRRDLRPS